MRIFDKCELNGYVFAILVDDEAKKAYEVVWNSENQCWDTDFSYGVLRVDPFDIAGLLDFKELEKQGYTFEY